MSDEHKGEATPEWWPADDFELYARKWTVEDRVLRYGHWWAKRHGLDPHLVEDLKDAFNADDESFEGAIACFFEALAEARENE